MSETRPGLPPNPNEGLRHQSEHLREIVLAGGHFWGLEAYLSRIYGVASTEVGYANGTGRRTSYAKVVYGREPHVLAVRVHYDESMLPLSALLNQFFRVIDPTAVDHQGHDWGAAFRSGIYYVDPDDLPQIKETIDQQRRRFEQRIATELRSLDNWIPAEQLHQQHLEKHPEAYCSVDLSLLPEGPLNGQGRPGSEANDFDDGDSLQSVAEEARGSGRAARFLNLGFGEEEEQTRRLVKQRSDRDDEAERRFPRPDDATLRTYLTAQQYRVTQEGETEAPFLNAYHDTEEPGLYVDIITGEPLFSSDAKFESGSGWPSFTAPLDENLIDAYEDMRFERSRIEVRSRHGDSHLGHVFDDGPPEAGGRRYCINSAALRFIPLARLEAEGYGDWIERVDPDAAYLRHEAGTDARGADTTDDNGDDHENDNENAHEGTSRDG